MDEVGQVGICKQVLGWNQNAISYVSSIDGDVFVTSDSFTRNRFDAYYVVVVSISMLEAKVCELLSAYHRHRRVGRL